MRIRAATRASPLARWQTDEVAALLRALDPAITVEVLVVSTEGDERTDVPIHAIGGRGVFAKEVQAAVLDGRADIAVHSAKDLTSSPVEGLVIAGVPQRANPCDALVGCRWADLPVGGVVATGSVRRKAQLAALRPDLRFEGLRGNIDTRLARAASFDAIVMAAAALERLGRSPEVLDVLPADLVVPQVGQGCLAIECRAGAVELRALLAGIEHSASRRALEAERAFLAELGGGCDLPVGAHATVGNGGVVHLDGLLAADDGSRVTREQRTGDDPLLLGRSLAAALREAHGEL